MWMEFRSWRSSGPENVIELSIHMDCVDGWIDRRSADSINRSWLHLGQKMRNVWRCMQGLASRGHRSPPTEAAC